MIRRYQTPSEVVRRNGILLVLSMALTFVILRVTLHAAPDTDLNVGSYNIHHLFLGLLLVAASGIPLVVFRGLQLRGNPLEIGREISDTIPDSDFPYPRRTPGSTTTSRPGLYARALRGPLSGIRDL